MRRNGTLTAGRFGLLRVGGALIAALVLCTQAAAAPAVSTCLSAAALRSSGTVNVRADNDLFGGLGQDQGYTNGFLLSWVSPNLAGYVDDPCLPDLVQGLNRYLAILHPESTKEQNMTIGLGQMMYTPVDKMRSDLIASDRPFAGALLLSFGYNARADSTMQTSQIRIGVIGPATLARQTQNWWHQVIGVEQFRGWDHQLRNEPVVQVLHERRTRYARHEGTNNWGWDLTGHWGASLGNFATYANVGAEWRIGIKLPNDLGTAPLRPAGENTFSVPPLPDGTWSGHLFVALDARWVLHDITLDGNTFRPSHSVDKHPLVADIGYGIALYYGQWRFAFARYHRTREFHGQPHVPVYGTVTLGRHF